MERECGVCVWGREGRGYTYLTRRVHSDTHGRDFDGWMDGWTDGRTDGWMDGWMDVSTVSLFSRSAAAAAPPPSPPCLFFGVCLFLSLSLSLSLSVSVSVSLEVSVARGVTPHLLHLHARGA